MLTPAWGAVEGDAERLDTGQAAAYLGIGSRTLSRMRVSGGGPRNARLRRRVVYDAADLEAWVEARKRTVTGEAEPD